MSGLKKFASLLKALGHPVRLKILENLIDGPCCASKANKKINISQPNLSQHLKALTETGIVDYRRVGTRHCFYITRPRLVKEILKALKLLDREIPITDNEVLEKIRNAQ
jgi:ArsR family transcriptional regulator